MPRRQRALINRLTEVVDFVKGLGRHVAVIENGDCVLVGFEDVRRICAITGEDSFMVATAGGEPNVFSPYYSLTDLEDTFILPYLHLVRFLPSIHTTN